MKKYIKLLSILFALFLAGSAFANGDVRTLSADDVTDDSAELVGEVTDGDNLEVWFAFDENDTTPSCSSSSQRESVSGRFDDGDEFTEEVNNLDEDERYYYRACVEDEDGDIVSGSVKNFTTDDEDNNDDVDITTLSATDIEENSVELRGEVDEGDDINVWFAIKTDSGSDPSCSNRSQREEVSGDFDEGDNFEERVSGLREDTKYAFRACSKDDDGDEVSGSVKTFTTDDDGRSNNSSSSNSDDVEDQIDELDRKMDILISLLTQLIQLQQFRF